MLDVLPLIRRLDDAYTSSPSLAIRSKVQLAIVWLPSIETQKVSTLLERRLLGPVSTYPRIASVEAKCHSKNTNGIKILAITASRRSDFSHDDKR